MSRYFVRLLGGAAVVVTLVVAVAFGFGASSAMPTALAQPATPIPTATRVAMHPLPPELRFLRGMTPTERFDHILSGQTTYLNPQGQHVMLNMIPGKISSVSANTVSITPNGTTQTRTFNVTSDTLIAGHPRAGSLNVFSPGDRVFVYVVDNSSNAAAIVAPRGHMMPMG